MTLILKMIPGWGNVLGVQLIEGKNILVSLIQAPAACKGSSGLLWWTDDVPIHDAVIKNCNLSLMDYYLIFFMSAHQGVQSSQIDVFWLSHCGWNWRAPLWGDLVTFFTDIDHHQCISDEDLLTLSLSLKVSPPWRFHLWATITKSLQV